jgi:hypothetical protein
MPLGIARGIASATLAALLVTPSVRPHRSTFAFQPGTYRYAVTTTVERSQDQPADRPPFTFQVVTKQRVSLTLAPLAADTLGLTITVDSISVSSSLAAPAPNLDHIRGAKLEGKLSPTGRVYTFQAPANADPETAALYGAFRRFLIPIPSNQLSVGSKWVDTTTDRVTKEGLDVTTRTITTSRVAADTTIGGQAAWRVDRNSVVEAHGAGTEAGRPLKLRNDGTIAGTHYIGTRGVYLGSTSTQRAEMLLSAGESETAMPIVQTIKSTVQPLPQR